MSPKGAYISNPRFSWGYRNVRTYNVPEGVALLSSELVRPLRGRRLSDLPLSPGEPGVTNVSPRWGLYELHNYMLFFSGQQ